LCSQERIWSIFAKKRGLKRKAGPPVHDDLVDRRFCAAAANEVWLTDITEHRTDEGKLYLCAVKDVYSNRIVGYSVDSRMKASLAVAALRHAVAVRSPVATIVHSDRGSRGGFNWSLQHLDDGGVDGQASGVDEGVDRALTDEVAGCAIASSRDPAAVLGRDRQGATSRGSRAHGGRVAGGRDAMVPTRWRHATVLFESVVGSVFVLR